MHMGTPLIYFLFCTVQTIDGQLVFNSTSNVGNRWAPRGVFILQSITSLYPR